VSPSKAAGHPTSSGLHPIEPQNGVVSMEGGPGSLEQRIWQVLEAIHDPEIPPLSLTDLGIVEGVSLRNETIEVVLLPTFAGCPALDVIRADVESAVAAVAPDHQVLVRFVYTKPWTSDRITAAGNEALASFGITPPDRDLTTKAGRTGRTLIPLAALHRVERMVTCPYCGSDQTVVESSFGPTLCRSTHFCRACRNPFEAFKPKTAD
jgi:ring-1,2-phenylacetyl-CoA epoxidase subunit PaaD